MCDPQVGAVEPDFLQAVINTSPQWLPDAGAASVVQVRYREGGTGGVQREGGGHVPWGV